MKCIIGLGNPGKQYENNYHNLGVIFSQLLLAKYEERIISKQEKDSCTIYKFAQFYLIIPKIYMNLSHKALWPVVSLYKISLSNILVMHDELMKKAGILNLKHGGGNAGHNGLRSITEHIGNDYFRLQIGIDHPKNLGNLMSVSDYVLSNIQDVDFYKKIFEQKGFDMIEKWIEKE